MRREKRGESPHHLPRCSSLDEAACLRAAMWRLPGGDDDLFEDDEDMMLYAAAGSDFG